MTRAISLFNRYKGDENAITNYVGVLLRMLHDAVPQGFAGLWAGWSGLAPSIGPKFLQQTKATKGIPDLLVEQRPVSIHFELKLGASFPASEIRKRIDDLAVAPAGGTKILVALGLQDPGAFEMEHYDLVADATSRGIHVMCVTFESLLSELRSVPRAPQDFLDLVDEFGAFAAEMDLLPLWRTQMTAVSCGETYEEFNRLGAYMCPDEGRSYSHQRSRFYGAYSERTISLIAQLKARVVLSPDPNTPATVYWCEDTSKHAELIAAARGIIAASSPARQDEAKQRPLQVFLLGSRHATDFRKRTPRGVPWSKKYFPEIAHTNETAVELAERLKSSTWAGSEEME